MHAGTEVRDTGPRYDGRYRQYQASSKRVFEVAVLFLRPVAFRLHLENCGAKPAAHKQPNCGTLKRQRAEPILTGLGDLDGPELM